MEHKNLLSHADIEKLKIEIKKVQWHIEDELSVAIETLENVIDEKDKEIDELNKKIEELEKPKTVERLSHCKEVKLSEITRDQYVVSADVYISPEKYRDYKNRVTFDVNGNEFYLGKGEVNNGRIKVKLISYSCYGLEEAKEIAKDLLRDGIYGKYKSVKGDNDNEHNVR